MKLRRRLPLLLLSLLLPLSARADETKWIEVVLWLLGYWVATVVVGIGGVALSFGYFRRVRRARAGALLTGGAAVLALPLLALDPAGHLLGGLGSLGGGLVARLPFLLPLAGLTLLLWGRLRARPASDEEASAASGAGAALGFVVATAAALLLLGHLRLPLHKLLGPGQVASWGLFLLTTVPWLAGALRGWFQQPPYAAASALRRLAAATLLVGAAGLLAGVASVLIELVSLREHPYLQQMLTANASAFALSVAWNTGSCALAGLAAGALAVGTRRAAAPTN